MSEADRDNLYRLLVGQLTDGIILTDKDGVIVSVNQAAESIRNIRQDDMLGKNILDCHKKTSRERILRAIHYLASNRDKTFKRMVTDDKNDKIYNNIYTAIYDERGDMAGMAIITKDVTEQKKTEEARANLARSQEITIENLREQYCELNRTSMEMLINIMESKDAYTDGHSKRVADIVSKLYRYRYGITDEYLDIQWAAKLHDIGKICIS